MNVITEELIKLCDKKYLEFSKKLIPDTKYEFIGVRVPVIKKIAKDLLSPNNKKLLDEFLNSQHKYYEEFFLHGIILGYLKTYNLENLVNQIELFIPFIDNWAICDSMVMNLKIIKKNPEFFFPYIKKWLSSNKPYTKRFAIVILLCYYLDKNFNNDIIELVAKIDSDNYYVNMACAWFFSVAIIKQYKNTISLLENKLLKSFIHNMTIQKAIDSHRISEDSKKYLKKLKIKKDI